MGRQRRQVRVEDDAAWVFNEMAAAYDARPSYPETLIGAIAALAPPAGRVLELGAGIGHLALPLAERGFDVVAIEPARAMLERLRLAAVERGIALRAVHAAAESLPFVEPAFDLSIIADAMHFVDAELVARELHRVLVPGGVLAIVTCEFAQTPFMDGVRRLLEAASDRRPRDVGQGIRLLATLADVRLTPPRHFHDQTPVTPATLERILRSFSFVGPAMNPERLGAFCARLHALSAAPTWARSFTLHAGLRRRRFLPWVPRPRTRGGAR
ncbi:MAG: class I SAM-dependent methyltransferase [Polyangiaceae bacterium]|nr:class I SAM-dependent methyltransferase [Polyangiaceae bacterium]